MKRAALLLAIGLLQMTGDLVGSPALRAIGAATGASPAPRVFSSVKGLETYSTRFFVEWTDRAGETRELELTPEANARLRGPYNRRNVFGAALAFGPVLATDERTRPMLEAVSRYALRGEAPILRELGIEPSSVVRVRVRYEPLPGTDLRELPRVLEPP